MNTGAIATTTMSVSEFPEGQGEGAALSSAPLFESYLMVDWSAAAVPRQGRDSIWLCHLRRAGDRLRARLENPSTRLEARGRILVLLMAELAKGRSVLAGFDFPFGYPAGFAARLEDGAGDWRTVWRLFSKSLVEGEGNANNRFAVAASLNERLCRNPAPFWGCPATREGEFLRARHHRLHEAIGLAEKRLADACAKGPQPVWKLYGNGSAGGQALTGIPVVHWLRERLGAAAAVWPFETGLRLLHRGRGGRVIFAEIYPSLVPAQPRRGEVKDAAQVRAIARHFAELDDAGCLAPLFAGNPGLASEERRRIEREESWILGVTRTSL
jgi:precorrin-8X/cobalt-precorrin-8 methylmutase